MLLPSNSAATLPSPGVWATSMCLPGAESGSEVFARYDEVIDEIALSGARTAAVVSHGTVIRTWAATRTPNVTADFAARSPLTNSGVVVLEGSSRNGCLALTQDGHALSKPQFDEPIALGVPHSLTEPTDRGHAKVIGDESGHDTAPGPLIGRST